MLTKIFQTARGSIVGRDHVGRDGLLLGRNNQDAYAIDHADNFILMVVCDGCSKILNEADEDETSDAEVGAKLLAKLLLKTVRRLLKARKGVWNDEERDAFWQEAQKRCLIRLQAWADDLSDTDSVSRIISQYFLSTAVLALVTPDETQIVSVGDGVFAVNGELITLGPFPDNEPPYLAYQISPRKNEATQRQSRLMVQRVLPTAELRSLLIGTDGVKDLMAAHERGKRFPGTSRMVGPVSDFWIQDHYFGNVDAVGRTLRLANTEVKQIVDGRLCFEPGLLRDDTTLAVLRRAEQSGP